MPTPLELFFAVAAFFALLAAFKRHVWPRIPILPGLFEDMNNGYSYDREGNRIEGPS